MARLRSGILGNIRGKVAGVVGSQWKDKNYVREYVKPANPNTAAQQVQRAKMTDAVSFCKPLVGPIFNAYTDKFQKSMSGFNFFIKRNIGEFDGSIDYGALKLSEGKLHAPGSFAAVYDTGDGSNQCSWDTGLGNNGEDDDSVYFIVYHVPTGLWYFDDGEVNRSIGAALVPIGTGLTATDLECYIVTSQYSGTLISVIADSQHAQSTAA